MILKNIPPLPENIINTIQRFVENRKRPCLFLFTTLVSSNTVYKTMKELGNKYFQSLDVILTTPGGNAEAAYNTSKLLRNSCDELNIFVPTRAKSAGTFITLSADNIYLGNMGELGPLDVQLQEIDEFGREGTKSALEEFKALEYIQKHAIATLDKTNDLINDATSLNIKDVIHLSNEFTGNTSGKLYEKVDVRKLGLYSRELEVGKLYGKKILIIFGKTAPQQAEEIVQRLVYGYPSHGFVIDDIEGKNLGLKIVDPGYEGDIMKSLNPILLQFEIALEKNRLNIDYIKLFDYNSVNENLNSFNQGNVQETQQIGRGETNGGDGGENQG